jgi:hypothetical protein
VHNLSFQYPTWYLLLCVLLGIIFAGILYFRDKTFKENSSKLNKILGLLRFFTTTIIAILLLSPVLKLLITDIKNPIIAVGFDTSESMRMAVKDSTQLKNKLEELQDQLGKGYDVKLTSFGDKVRDGLDFGFKDKQTNISEFVSNAYNQYEGQNLAGLIMVTDGIYNIGNNPLYAETKLNVPIFSIALGDTTPKKDLLIKNIYNNNIVYLNDKFNVQADLSAFNCAGNNTTLTISKINENGSSSIQSMPVSIPKNDFFLTKEFTIEAKEPGVQHYRINVNNINGEINTINNSKDFYIEVLDARQKVLIIANSPHPDIAAMKEAITNNKNYTVTVSYITEPKANPLEFDFVIFHQLPSITNSIDGIINNLNIKRISRMFVVGSQTNTKQLNSFQNAITFNTENKNMNEVQGVINSNFNNFTIEDIIKKNVPQFNVLSAPFGDFKENTGTQTLIYQRIGKIDTKYPLLCFADNNGIKTGIVAAEGLWKWRLSDYLQNKNFETFDLLISKSMQYLSVKEDKRKFKITLPKNIFSDNEDIDFGAELYNNSYELVNEPDIKLVITNAAKKSFNYTFNKSGRSYTLNVGQFPEGNYTYKATTSYSGQALNATGSFNIQPLQLELYETTANHGLLRAMANKYGGLVVNQNQIDALVKDIKNRVNIKPLLYQTNRSEAAINLKLIFGLLILLLGGEWFLRKYFGSY